MRTEIATVRKAFERVAQAERELDTARAARSEALAAAKASGVSLSAIGREVGLSRQRIGAMIRQG
jgi:hypothetical protein